HPCFLAAWALGVDDCRHLAVRVDRAEGRQVLLALARVDRHRLKGQAGFFEEQRDFRGVRRRMEIELDHGLLPLSRTFQKCGTSGWTFRSEADAHPDDDDRNPLGWQRYLAENRDCEERGDHWQERNDCC